VLCDVENNIFMGGNERKYQLLQRYLIERNKMKKQYTAKYKSVECNGNIKENLRLNSGLFKI
jgi:hypothetical protein